MIRSALFAASVAMLGAAPALGGEQYVDETGYAVSGYDVVSYFALEQAPRSGDQPDPKLGRADITAEYNGATFAFASAANRDAFLADPERYSPQYDGHCAYGVAVGNKVPANPTVWRIVDGKLYLNITQRFGRKWERDIAGYERDAQAEWPELEPRPASEDDVPWFRASGPIAD